MYSFGRASIRGQPVLILRNQATVFGYGLRSFIPRSHYYSVLRGWPAFGACSLTASDRTNTGIKLVLNAGRRPIYLCIGKGPIAQLVERAPDKGEVGSSTLPGPTIPRWIMRGMMRQAQFGSAGLERAVNGAVAQLGEHRLCKPRVAGSIPVRSTKVHL